MPNPFISLKKDHKLTEGLFRLVEMTGSRMQKTRDRLFTRIARTIERHEQLEEETLYPFLDTKPDLSAIAARIASDHTSVRSLIARVRAEAIQSDAWMDTVRALHAAVQHHVSAEESTLFRTADLVLGEAEKADLARQIKDARSRRARAR